MAKLNIEFQGSNYIFSEAIFPIDTNEIVVNPSPAIVQTYARQFVYSEIELHCIIFLFGFTNSFKNFSYTNLWGTGVLNCFNKTHWFIYLVNCLYETIERLAIWKNSFKIRNMDNSKLQLKSWNLNLAIYKLTKLSVLYSR